MLLVLEALVVFALPRHTCRVEDKKKKDQEDQKGIKWSVVSMAI
jgi:hypothetical protein